MPRSTRSKRLVVRVWRTKIDERRAPEYERFARERSVPMFQAHEGFVGVLFTRSGQHCAVITLWAGPEYVERLEASTHYKRTVSDISATRFLIGPSSVEVFELHGGALDPAALAAAGVTLPSMPAA
jgi:heme-degrading monooxygenase HmoA